MPGPMILRLAVVLVAGGCLAAIFLKIIQKRRLSRRLAQLRKPQSEKPEIKKSPQPCWEASALLSVFRAAGLRYLPPLETPPCVGEALEVRAEENPYDCNALRLLRPDGTSLGYVPRRCNTLPAMLQKEGWRLWAGVRRWDGEKEILEISLYAQEGEK